MNVDCTRQGTLFLPLSLIHFLNDEMHTLNSFLFILFNIRSHHPWMCTVYAYVCLFNRHLARFCSSLAVTCSFSMSSLLNIIMNIRKRKKNAKSIQRYALRVFFVRVYFTNTYTSIDRSEVE